MFANITRVLIFLLGCSAIFCAVKCFVEAQKLKRLPKAVLRVDGRRREFAVVKLTKHGITRIACWPGDGDFRCVMSSDPDFERALRSQMKQIRTNVPATLEILGEIVKFEMEKVIVLPTNPSDTWRIDFYRGIFLHDFAGEGQFTGYTDLLFYVVGGGSRRRRKTLIALGLPKLEFPGLMPQTVPA